MNAATPRRRNYVFAWLATCFGLVAVAHGNFETTDAGFTMHAAHGLWVRGDSGLRRADQGGELPGEVAGAGWIHKHEAEGNRSNGKVGVNGLAYAWFPMGHVWLLVPFVAVGDALRTALPDVEAAYRQRVDAGAYPEGSPVLMQGPIALLVPAACMATTALLLFLLARALGATVRDAAISTLAIVFATQCFALGRETLSDGPGLMLLVGALLGTVRTCQGGPPRTALLAGLVAGAAVLLRYQTALAVIAMALAIGIARAPGRRWRDLLLFAAGGAPALALMLLVNHARFGDAFDTGYPEASDWLAQPIWLGAAKILFGAGRGVMWLSPLMWVALPLAMRRVELVRWRWLAWVLFLTPLVFFAMANGWQGGRCWAVRYVTPGVVALLALVLPQTAPWRRWPKAWLALLAFGVFANVTSIVAPVRGVLQLGGQAYEATGGVNADAADVNGWHPRYTPLLVNWRYAAASFGGAFEDGGRQRNGSAHTIEALFGVAAKTDGQGRAPDRWEDRAGRHLWWRFWGELLAVPWWALLLLPLALATLFAVLAARGAPPSPLSTAT